MQEFLVAVVAFPTIVFTFGLAVALLYWLVVIFGALDLDFLDSALGLDSMDAALDGALESIDGMADGAVEGVVESIDGAVDGAAEGAADAADSGDTSDGARQGALSRLLNMMGVRGVPITVVASFVLLWAWIISMVGSKLLGAAAATFLVGGFLTGSSVLGSLVLAAVTARPFRKIFVTPSAPSRVSLVGKICIVTSAKVDGEFGRAEIDDGATGFVAEVRCPQDNQLTRGANALVYRYDPADGVFFIGPVDDALAAASNVVDSQSGSIGGG